MADRLPLAQYFKQLKLYFSRTLPRGCLSHKITILRKKHSVWNALLSIEYIGKRFESTMPMQQGRSRIVISELVARKTGQGSDRLAILRH